MRYMIIIEQTETGFSAYVPDLPGNLNILPNQEGLPCQIMEK